MAQSSYLFLMSIMVAHGLSCSTAMRGDVPNWVNFPDEKWETITPKESGLDVEKFNAWVKSQSPQFGKAYGGQKPEKGGVVIARGGYIIHTWGNPNFKYQSASLGKTFTRMALQLAIDEGLVKNVDDLVMNYWIGEGQLEPHKVLNQGYHRNLTFRHLQDMVGGFPTTNGYFWRNKKDVPSWAKYTGDPDYDNYSHIEPGVERCYSSGGYWRLSQVLTAIWQQDLKALLDEKIMSEIGIPKNRWYWISGEDVRNDIDFYPDMSGYGDYLDPPYRINGIPVRGGGGWVVMSAKDFARLGLLIATGGIWEGECLISKIGGNVGVGANTVDGWDIVNGKDGYFSFGKVATHFNDPKPEQMASWIVGPVAAWLRPARRKNIQPSSVDVDTAAIKMEEAMVPMRDGVKLHTKIWKPTDGGSYPVVFTRAYWPGFGRDYERFTKAGYVYVGQSTRGHGQSEGADGVDNRFFDDAEDGYDSLTWISQQPWCDGNIAMYGKSYWAATQWLVAPLQHPNLKAIVPQNVNPDFWERGYRDHGALQLAHTARRIYDAGGKEKVENYGWLNWYRHLPLITLDTVAGTGRNKLWRDYVTHSTYDDFWQVLSTRDKYHKIRIPVYLMCGWYDNYPSATLKYFEKLKKLNATDKIRVVINPSDHLNKVVGDRDFGRNAQKDEVGLAIRWLDYVIKGIDTGIKDEPPVKIFVMGINKWRFENEWPLARTQFTKYYFHSDGSKDGWLSIEPPGDEPPIKYIYDPDNPVPTLGGNHSSPEIPGIMRVGAVDQRSNENRDDALVFTSSPLQEDTEITGPILVKLYAASSARDTDFIARLIDVHPDGTAYNLTEGIIRARFRESIWEPPKFLVPGKIYEYTIELLPTSNVFLKGHSIRVHITSSNFPLWDRNPNTGNEQGMDAEMQIVEQTIYHDGKYPSHIALPIIPQGER
ncbi:CocE/NonD family hydrolase [bacterium]|nr:CocE/NonD family hydrolase [bacterium]